MSYLLNDEKFVQINRILKINDFFNKGERNAILPCEFEGSCVICWKFEYNISYVLDSDN